MKTVYQDTIYKDSTGRYFTGEYLKNNKNIIPDLVEGYTEISHKTMDWDELQNELTGKTIRCNYTQIFPADSQMILCNELPTVFPELWDSVENGDYYDDENDTYSEIFQFYIIDGDTAEQLKEHTDNIIFYIDALDLYVLGVTHWGTSWNYVPEDFIY